MAQGTVFQVPWVRNLSTIASLKGKSKWRPHGISCSSPTGKVRWPDSDPGYLKNGTLGYLA